MVLYSQLRHQILTKNYIKNPSGHGTYFIFKTYSPISWRVIYSLFFVDDLNGWTNLNGYEWRVEQEPLGCAPLPDTFLFGRNDRSCFIGPVDRDEDGRKYYIIDLWNEGLTPTIINLISPFKIKCSQMCIAAYRTGYYNWQVFLLTSTNKCVGKHQQSSLLPASPEWKTLECSFRLRSSDVDQTKDLRYVVFEHEGYVKLLKLLSLEYNEHM